MEKPLEFVGGNSSIIPICQGRGFGIESKNETQDRIKNTRKPNPAAILCVDSARIGRIIGKLLHREQWLARAIL